MLKTLEAKIEALRMYFPSAYAVVFYSGPRRHLFSEVVGFRHVSLRPRQLLHLAWPVILWSWVRNEQNQSAVIVRSAFPSPISKILFRSRKFLLVTEHHTVFLEELKLLFRASPRLLGAVHNIARNAQDQILDGKICVTDEIAHHEKFSGKILVSANSTQAPIREARLQAYFSGEELRIGMPSSRDFPWHGEDRLVASTVEWAREVPELSIQVDIIGYGGSTENPHPRVMINRLSHLDTEDLVAHFNNVHFGVSSLGLFRKGMEEASPLKSRFFAAQRIPFIYGYRDPDIDSDNCVTLRVSNREGTIPWSEVKSFLAVLNEKDHDQAWSLLQKSMSIERKAERTHDFLENLRQEPGSHFK